MGSDNFFRKVAGVDQQYFDPMGGHTRILNGVFGSPPGAPPPTPYFAGRTPTLADANNGYQTPVSPYAAAAGAMNQNAAPRMGTQPISANNVYSR